MEGIRMEGIRMEKSNIHVALKGEFWEVEEEGNPDGIQKFASQAAAMVAGRELAKEKKVDFIVHAKDGSIKQRDSY
jgi:hypothetical protein